MGPKHPDHERKQSEPSRRLWKDLWRSHLGVPSWLVSRSRLLLGNPEPFLVANNLGEERSYRPRLRSLSDYVLPAITAIRQPHDSAAKCCTHSSICRCTHLLNRCCKSWFGTKMQKTIEQYRKHKNAIVAYCSIVAEVLQGCQVLFLNGVPVLRSGWGHPRAVVCSVNAILFWSVLPCVVTRLSLSLLRAPMITIHQIFSPTFKKSGSTLRHHAAPGNKVTYWCGSCGFRVWNCSLAVQKICTATKDVSFQIAKMRYFDAKWCQRTIGQGDLQWTTPSQRNRSVQLARYRLTRNKSKSINQQLSSSQFQGCNKIWQNAKSIRGRRAMTLFLIYLVHPRTHLACPNSMTTTLQDFLGVLGYRNAHGTSCNQLRPRGHSKLAAQQWPFRDCWCSWCQLQIESNWMRLNTMTSEWRDVPCAKSPYTWPTSNSIHLI